MAATIKISGTDITINEIATEQTQKELLRAMQGKTKTSGITSLNTASGKAGEATDSFGKKVGQTAGLLVGAFGNTAKSLAEFGLAAFDHQAKLSTATDILAKNFKSIGPVLAGPASDLIKVGEQYIDVFRDVSKSGLTFNADLFELKNTAGQARMSLDDFAYVIKQSSTDLAAIGGNASAGAKLFAQISKEFFDTNKENIEELGNMGMGVEAINDMLMNQMKIQKRANFEDVAQRNLVIQSALGLARQMDSLSKLTGKQKEAIQEEINATMRKGQIEAKLREIELEFGRDAAIKARAALEKTVAAASFAGPDAVAALEEQFIQDTVYSQQARKGVIALGDSAETLMATINEITKNPKTIDQSVDDLILDFQAALIDRLDDPNMFQLAKLQAAGNEYGQAAATVYENAGDLSTAIQKIRDEAEFRNADTRTILQEVNRRAEEERKAREKDDTGEIQETAGQALTRTMNNAELAIASIGTVINDKLIGDQGALNHFQVALTETANMLGTLDASNMNDSINEMLGPIEEYFKQILDTDMKLEVPEEAMAGQKDFYSQLQTYVDNIDKKLQDTTIQNDENQRKALEKQKESAIELSATVGALASVLPNLAADYLEFMNQESPNASLEEKFTAFLSNLDNKNISEDIYQREKEIIDEDNLDIQLPDFDTFQRNVNQSIADIKERKGELAPTAGQIDFKSIRTDIIQVDKILDKAGGSAFNTLGDYFDDFFKTLNPFSGSVISPEAQLSPESKIDLNVETVNDKQVSNLTKGFEKTTDRLFNNVGYEQSAMLQSLDDSNIEQTKLLGQLDYRDVVDYSQYFNDLNLNQREIAKTISNIQTIEPTKLEVPSVKVSITDLKASVDNSALIASQNSLASKIDKMNMSLEPKNQDVMPKKEIYKDSVPRSNDNTVSEELMTGIKTLNTTMFEVKNGIKSLNNYFKKEIG